MSLFRRAQRDAELNEEIRSHLEMAEQDRIDSGEPAPSARYAAHREFGNLAIAREDTREALGWMW